MDSIFDLTTDVERSYVSGFAARLYVGPEPGQYQTQVGDVSDRLLDNYGEHVKVINWNRLAGFFQGEPPTTPPEDKKSNAIEIALNLMIKGEKEMERDMAQGRLPRLTAPIPFDPKGNIIFLIHEIDAILAEKGGNGQLVTLLRSYINANMGAPRYDEGEDTPDRGKRMLVFLATGSELGRYLPELTAVPVALPGCDASRRAVDNVFGPLIRQHAEDSAKGVNPLTEEEYDGLCRALQGMPYQEREDAISKAVTAHRDDLRNHQRIYDFTSFVASIEDEKARFIRGIKGVSYVPKMSLPVDRLPGYEAMDAYIDEVSGFDPLQAREHNLPPARGVLLVGAPGTGKTEAAKAAARKSNSLLLSVSLGEIQGRYVGDSEENARKLLDLIASLGHCVVMVDEIDKAGTGAVQDAGGNQSFGRVMAMFLSFMTDPANQAIFILTANNLVSARNPDVPLIPAPLIRAGRLDERFYVDLPDDPVRRSILTVLAKRYRMDFGSDQHIADLSAVCEDFTGAELNDIVIRGVRHALRNELKHLGIATLLERAKGLTPIARQPAFRADLEANRKACEQFTVIGRSQTATQPKPSPAGRRGRAVLIGA